MELENLSKEAKEQTVSDFLSLVDAIPDFTIKLVDENKLSREHLKNEIIAVAENSMKRIRSAANRYLAKNISLKDVKDILCAIVSRETDSLVIADVDDRGKQEIVKPERLREINAFAINSFSELNTLTFAKNLYNNVFSRIRTQATKKYSGNQFLMLQSGMQPPTLKEFDELIEKLKREQGIANNSEKPSRKKHN